MQHNSFQRTPGTAQMPLDAEMATDAPRAPLATATDVNALRARNTSLREGVSSQLQGLGAEMCQSLLRHADVEAVADFAHGDDDYAPAPGIAYAIITQLKSVEGVLEMPAAEALALVVEKYFTEFLDYVIELCTPTGGRRLRWS
jgi:hypothetical protein